MIIDGEDRADVLILIRIHTAMHTAKEAVALAAFIKGILPNAQILGTSASAVLCEGKLIHDQCVISVTQMDEGSVLAALNGDSLECLADFATGVQVVGDPHEITKVAGDHILEIDGQPAAEFIHDGIGEEICTKTEIGFYFPLAYSFGDLDVPFVIGYYGADGIGANHNVTAGRKVHRGFFYDRKIISDNRSMYGRMESFEKGETLFAYACRDRFRIYPNSVVWELSAYENSRVSRFGALPPG